MIPHLAINKYDIGRANISQKTAWFFDFQAED